VESGPRGERLFNLSGQIAAPRKQLHGKKVEKGKYTGEEGIFDRVAVSSRRLRKQNFAQRKESGKKQNSKRGGDRGLYGVSTGEKASQGGTGKTTCPEFRTGRIKKKDLYSYQRKENETASKNI